MEKDREQGTRLNGGPEFFHLLFIQRRIVPSPRVSGEELDGFAASSLSPFDDPGEPSCNGDMKPKSHFNLLNKRELEAKIYRSVMNCQYKLTNNTI